MSERRKECANCAYWLRDLTSGLGKCRRNPPTADRDALYFPETPSHMWCGEFKYRKEKSL